MRCRARGRDREVSRIRRSLGTSHLIYTEHNSNVVFDAIRKKTGLDKESLIVLTVPQPYTGRAPTHVKLWFQRLHEKYNDVVPLCDASHEEQ